MWRLLHHVFGSHFPLINTTCDPQMKQDVSAVIMQNMPLLNCPKYLFVIYTICFEPLSLHKTWVNVRVSQLDYSVPEWSVAANTGTIIRKKRAHCRVPPTLYYSDAQMSGVLNDKHYFIHNIRCKTAGCHNLAGTTKNICAVLKLKALCEGIKR